MSSATALGGAGWWTVRAIERTYAVLLVSLGILGIVLNRAVCLGEAFLSQHLLRFAGLVDDPQSIGAAVIFADGNRYIGFLVTPGCSVAMLLAPFTFFAGVMVWIGRGGLRSLVGALGLLAVIFVLTNQIRLAVVAIAMSRLGFERGYDISHVTIGSIISALGLVVGVVVFVIVLTRDVRPTKGTHRA